MSVFENLRQAFREAVENFKEELNRDQVPETVDRLLHAMREEMTDVRAHLRKLEQDVELTEAALAREKKDVETCLRREHMALEIGDQETATVAREYAEKHERKRVVMEQKLEALRDEQSVLRAEFEEMTRQFKEAQSSKASLSASAGRSQARGSIQDAGDLFDQMDRMAERIADEDARAQAAEEMGEDFGFGGAGSSPDIPPARDLDERLKDLKRRLGEE
jgi:phage shock protein A